MVLSVLALQYIAYGSNEERSGFSMIAYLNSTVFVNKPKTLSLLARRGELMLLLCA